MTEIRGWTAAAEQLARYHRSAGVDAVRHHPFSTVLSRGEALLRDETVLRGWGLNDGQRRDLIAALSELRRLWKLVGALHLPDSPVRGDIHPKTALSDGQRARLFNWSEASVAHPLTYSGWSISRLARQRWPLVEADPDLAQELAPSYLQALGLPGAHAEMAAPLALLQRAVVYDATFKNWAPKPQSVPCSLRRSLSKLPTPSLSLPTNLFRDRSCTVAVHEKPFRLSRNSTPLRWSRPLVRAEIRLFWEAARRRLARQLTYRRAATARLLTDLFFGVLRMSVLLVLLQGCGLTAGFSASDAVAYTWIIQALIMVMSLFGWFELMSTVSRGEVGSDLLRPYSDFGFWLAGVLASQAR